MQADRIYCGDALTVLKTLPDISVNCCITSPPYYALRDYGVDGQIGREETPALYVERLTSIFREVRRVLTPDGTLWLNIADTYAGKGNQGDSLDPKYPNGRTGQAVALNGKVEGCKAKDMIGIPWLLAFALRADGWYLRSDIIWMKANPMPESTKDRPSRCYEHIFLLSKSRRYANSDHATVRVGKCNQVNGKGFRVNPRALAVKERRFHRTTYLFNRHFAAHARTPSS